MIHLLRFLAWVFGLDRPAKENCRSCPDFIEDGTAWMEDPDEIENARWYAENCFQKPAARR